jgi:hypothetical protein
MKEQRMRKIVRALCERVGVDDFEIVDVGYILNKNETFVKTMRNVALGRVKNDEIDEAVAKVAKEIEKVISEQKLDRKQLKIVYRVSTWFGVSRLYIIRKTQ